MDREHESDDIRAARRFLERLAALPDLTAEVKEAARRAVRALLARPWLLTPESFKFVYEPFETFIPADSL